MAFENSKTRIKSAMVIYELERELGRYVRERPHNVATSPTGRDILLRSGNVLNASNSELVGSIVENSYLDEALRLATDASRGTADERHISQLRKLVETLEIFDIRNAVSHPNRTFPECYWYRCAAIAADPTVDALNFVEVSRAFQSALAGNIDEPPEDWLYQRQWITPNGLPEEFEHSVTGLFGRTKDIVRLNKELRNSRSSLIAVIARGGIGKTSLVLQALSDFCLSSDSTSFSDGVVYVSLKQERLSHEGLQVLDAPSTIAEVKSILCTQVNQLLGFEARDFEECVSHASNKKLWLFVDNLETLLRDSPLSFSEFYDSLPAQWKVIVTSRIPVDGGKNIPIEALEETGAFAFCRQYFESKGHPISDAELIQRIITGCQFNPLAIRLVIDSFIAGKDISSSLQDTTEEVTSFSFANLLEALSDDANNVLEALFVIDRPTRSELCEALEADLDRVSSAIAELVRTSLVLRSDNEAGEVYMLGTSIRELLRSSPRNRKVRSSTLEWVQKTRASAAEALRRQVEKNVSILDILYVPTGTNSSLIPLAGQISAATKKRDLRTLSQLEIKMRSLLEGNPSSSFLHRLYGKVLVGLDDLQGAEKHFRKAISIDPTDPAPKLAIAILLQRMQGLDEAYAYCKELIDAGWGEAGKAGLEANSVWRQYLTILNFREELDLVFSYTQNWKEAKKSPSVFGVSRASAYRRLADKEFRVGTFDWMRIEKFICSAAQNLSDVLKIDGPSRPAQNEIKKLVNELDYYVGKRHVFSEESSKLISEFLNQNRTEILQICEVNLAQLISRFDVKQASAQFKSTINSVGGNGNSPSREEMEAKGFTMVTVKYLPKSDGFPNYVFANDKNSNSYYLNVDAFEDGNWREWVFVEKGTELAIKHQGNNTGTARKATEIRKLR
ncbi:MAG: NB-ARC domain-containing protein [Sideroxydans sp.]|nr:NB-ARC domain-containing protein [Sideroxydans sp.]